MQFKDLSHEEQAKLIARVKAHNARIKRLATKLDQDAKSSAAALKRYL